MKILAPGTEVVIDETQRAVIASISIFREQLVQYHCEWWVEGQLLTGQFDAERVRAKEPGEVLWSCEL